MAGTRLWIAVIYVVQVLTLITVAVYCGLIDHGFVRRLVFLENHSNNNNNHHHNHHQGTSDLIWHWFCLWRNQTVHRRPPSPQDLWASLVSRKLTTTNTTISLLPTLNIVTSPQHETQWNGWVKDYRNHNKNQRRQSISISVSSSLSSSLSLLIANQDERITFDAQEQRQPDTTACNENLHKLFLSLDKNKNNNQIDNDVDLWICHDSGRIINLENNDTATTTNTKIDNKIFHHVDSGTLMLLTLDKQQQQQQQPALDGGGGGGGGDATMLHHHSLLLPLEEPTLSVRTCLEPTINLILLVLEEDNDDDDDDDDKNKSFESWNAWLSHFYQAQTLLQQSFFQVLNVNVHVQTVVAVDSTSMKKTTTTNGRRMEEGSRNPILVLHLEEDDAMDHNMHHTQKTTTTQGSNHSRRTSPQRRRQRQEQQQRRRKLWLSDLELFLEEQQQEYQQQNLARNGQGHSTIIPVFLLVQPMSSSSPIVVLADEYEVDKDSTTISKEEDDNSKEEEEEEEQETLMDFLQTMEVEIAASDNSLFVILPPLQMGTTMTTGVSDVTAENVSEYVVRRMASWITRRCIGLSQHFPLPKEEGGTTVSSLEWNDYHSYDVQKKKKKKKDGDDDDELVDKDNVEFGQSTAHRSLSLPRWFVKLFWHRAISELYREAFLDAREAIRRYKAWVDQEEKRRQREEEEDSIVLVLQSLLGQYGQPPLPQPLSAGAELALEKVCRAHDWLMRNTHHQHNNNNSSAETRVRLENYEQAVHTLLSLPPSAISNNDDDDNNNIDSDDDELLLSQLILDFGWDHYAAIFAPLLAPLLLPAVLGAIRECFRYRSKKKKKIVKRNGTTVHL